MGKRRQKLQRRKRNRFKNYPGYAYVQRDENGRRYWGGGSWNEETRKWKQGPINWRPTAPLYFAYGSNLNVEQMAERAPEATPFCALALADWRLVFRGIADITPAKGESVQGGLWRITGADEAALDNYEGVKHGLYFKQYFVVTYTDPETDEEIAEDVLFYVMGSDDGHEKPWDYYLETIRQGYQDFGLNEQALNQAVKAAPERAETTKGYKSRYHASKANAVTASPHHSSHGARTSQSTDEGPRRDSHYTDPRDQEWRYIAWWHRNLAQRDADQTQEDRRQAAREDSFARHQAALYQDLYPDESMDDYDVWARSLALRDNGRDYLESGQSQAEHKARLSDEDIDPVEDDAQDWCGAHHRYGY